VGEGLRPGVVEWGVGAGEEEALERLAAEVLPAEPVTGPGGGVGGGLEVGGNDRGEGEGAGAGVGGDRDLLAGEADGAGEALAVARDEGAGVGESGEENEE
jgi:hypothetical protein